MESPFFLPLIDVLPPEALTLLNSPHLVPKLCLGTPCLGNSVSSRVRETEFRGDAFPSGVWERVTVPLIDVLPPEVQTFLNSGGWLLVLGAVALLALAVLFVLGRRLLGRFGRAAPVAQLAPTEDLSTYPPPPALWGAKRLTVHGLPARLRLVVLAPLGTEAGQVYAEEAETLLERVVLGLGAFVRSDKPRVRVWPTQLSHQGFIAAFRRHTLFPGGDEHEPSRWVLLMGRVHIDRRTIGVGLALLADQDNMLGRITLEHVHQWTEALRIKTPGT